MACTIAARFRSALSVEVLTRHGYFLKYALTILKPVLLIVWAVFFR